MIEIDLCQKKDITKVQNFINNHWKKGHILSYHSNLLKWMYKRKEGLNFILAKQDENIIGILGFIKNSQFSKKSKFKDIIWLALWKVIEEKAAPGLGILMLKKLEKLEPDLDIAVIGINKSLPPIFRVLNYYSDVMDHYYIVNPKIKNFYILSNENESLLPYPIISKNIIIYRQVFENDFLKNKYNYISKNFTCFKSASFFLNKYLNHPIYQYKLFHLEQSEEKFALIVIRIININNTNVVRVIDFEGDESLISHMGQFLLNILVKENAEYVDFLQHGIKKNYFLNSGFNLLNSKQKIIIPNYFEPFVRDNIPLLFSYKLDKNTNIRIFKGDGDQDRPNLVKHYEE
jgi:hypothetical protein